MPPHVNKPIMMNHTGIFTRMCWLDLDCDINIKQVYRKATQ